MEGLKIKSRHTKREILLVLSFLVPAFIVLSIVIIYPILFAMRASLFRWSPLVLRGAMRWVGFGNYQKALFVDAYFWRSLQVTFFYMAACVSLSTIIGLGLAILLSVVTYGKNIARSILLLPILMAPAAVGLLLKQFFFEATFGWINYFLGLVGIGKILWLGKPDTAFLTVVLTGTWIYIPLIMLVMEAALNSLPKEPFEAARIDGASPWKIFTHITLPLIKGPLVFVILMRITSAFRHFDTIYVMTEGGPGDATNVMSVEVYWAAFRELKWGYANTHSTLMFIMVAAICLIFIYAVGKKSIVGEGLWQQ